MREMTMRGIWIVLNLFVAACTVACTNLTETAVRRAASMTCHAAYRSGPSVLIEREETFTFNDEDGLQELDFADLSLNAQYSAGEIDNERALRLWVTEAGETAELTAQLYQLERSSGPQNQFVGGHGFTGLNYVYHPVTGAELQFWCTAE
jgi:hypothetical protein